MPILTITIGIPDRVVVIVFAVVFVDVVVVAFVPVDVTCLAVVVVAVVGCSCLQIKSLSVPHLSSRCH